MGTYEGDGWRWERGAAAVICVGAALVGLRLFGRSLWGVAAPFLLAWLLSRGIRPLVRMLCGEKGRGRRAVSALLVLLFTAGAVALPVAGVRRAMGELGRLADRLAAEGDGLPAMVDAALERARSLSAHIPLLRRFEDTPGYGELCQRVDGLLSAGVSRLLEAATERLPAAAMSAAGRLPTAFLFITVTLLAGYYFTADDGSMGVALRRAGDRLLPPSLRAALPPLGRRLGRLAGAFGRSYLLLGLLTFLLSFIGLAVLGVPYAFLLACVIALVDLLPLLGTGIVLIPWGGVCLLTGRVRLGVGLLVLYGVTTLARQVAEPRLVGKGLGLHPLLSLLAAWGGWRLGGVLGMLAGPLAVAFLKETLLGPRSGDSPPADPREKGENPPADA